MTDVELIIGFCESNQIKNYTINPDGSIDVEGFQQLNRNLQNLNKF